MTRSTMSSSSHEIRGILGRTSPLQFSNSKCEVQSMLTVKSVVHVARVSKWRCTGAVESTYLTHSDCSFLIADRLYGAAVTTIVAALARLESFANQPRWTWLRISPEPCGVT